MNSRKTLLIALLLLFAAGISFNLPAQEKKVHVKVITNGKGTDTVYTITSKAGSESNGEVKVVIVTNTDKAGNSRHDIDSIIELEVETPDIDDHVKHAIKNIVMIRRSGGGEEDEEMDEMNFNFPGMPESIDENADFGKIKVTTLMGKNLIRVSLDLSGKENTVIKINEEDGKAIFEEKIKDLTGKYIRDIDMTGNEKGKYSLSIERGKSNIVRQFRY